ncbi:hypothetical protein TWF694_001471 [Orbilia ellipsospora]|uniref:Uncharacterized protein n=1 Tax=Orbilia ellipsospora TaxID=2528407 RepID=A0AAV9XY87_9PEZI
MAGKVLLQTSLCSPSVISLGRMIVDIKSPQRRFHDPFPERYLPSTVQKERNIRETSQRMKGSKAGARLTELISLFAAKTKLEDIHVESITAVTYILCQWDDIFREACASHATRKWLEGTIEDGKDVFFIVGFKMLLDPRIEEKATKSKKNELELQLPVNAAMSIAGVNPLGFLLDGVGDPAISNETKKSITESRLSEALGECVYAIQYCKVNFKWYSSKKIEKSQLGANKWQIYLGIRGAGDYFDDEEGSADEMEDVVETELIQDFDFTGEGGLIVL